MNIINFLATEDVWWGVPDKLKFLSKIVAAIESVLWPILIVVATIGSIYAIYLGINMAKAEESGKRDEARKHLINAVIAMAVTVVMILLINVVIIPNIPNWIGTSSVTTADMSEMTGTRTGTIYEKIRGFEEKLGTATRTGENGGNNVSIWEIRYNNDRYLLTVESSSDGKVTSVTNEKAS